MGQIFKKKKQKIVSLETNILESFAEKTHGCVVLCHGYGANADDLVPLATALDPLGKYNWYFPEAPLSLGMGFYAAAKAWFHLDLELLEQRNLKGDYQPFINWVPPELSQSVAAVSELCCQVRKNEDRFFLGGFSQGGMVALHSFVGLRFKLDGLILMSSGLVASGLVDGSIGDRSIATRLFQSHGRQDNVLPYPMGEYLNVYLQQKGMSGSFIDFDGQHEIPAKVIHSLGHFLCP